MGIRETARTELAQRLADRTRALGDRFERGETPIASSAGELIRQEPMPPEGASADEILAYFPAPDGDFVLTDRTLYYRDKRGNIYLLPLATITSWRQRSCDAYPHLSQRLQRRILEIEVSTSGGGRYLIESGKIFARQIRKTGRIRRRRW